jgi:23S rRNA pseudouridine1911/1915/1917 synthase
MPSKNMLPKGDRRKSVKAEYRAQRTLAQEREAELKRQREESGEFFDEDTTAARSWSTAQAEEPKVSKSPWANKPGLVTSGPESGKMPPEFDTQSTPRYGSPYTKEEAKPDLDAIQVMEDLEPEDGVRSFTADAAAKDIRLDAYLARAIPDISRARVVLMIDNGQIAVDGKPGKAKLKLKGGELIEIEGDPRPEPLNAVPEDIPLTIVYEDADLAVIDKPAGMMVHAGSGAPEHNQGTLVNALLHHMGKELSGVGGELRPGIVHRLDKQTSGLIVVAKNDVAHRKLSEMFSPRSLRKVYLALVHGEMQGEEGTVQLPISRDVVRRIRMTTKRAGGRTAVSHWKVLERIGTDERPGPYGKFTLVQVHIETGRTHQIRVHMQAIGHPVVGDFLYGAPHRIFPAAGKATGLQSRKAIVHDDSLALELERNFLHAAELEFQHPRTGEELALSAPLPPELVEMLAKLRPEA